MVVCLALGVEAYDASSIPVAISAIVSDLDTDDDSGGAGVVLPYLLTADDMAELLRTSRKAIYSMAHRGELPGVTRIGRRMLIRRDDVLAGSTKVVRHRRRSRGDER